MAKRAKLSWIEAQSRFRRLCCRLQERRRHRPPRI